MTCCTNSSRSFPRFICCLPNTVDSRPAAPAIQPTKKGVENRRVNQVNCFSSSPSNIAQPNDQPVNQTAINRATPSRAIQKEFCRIVVCPLSCWTVKPSSFVFFIYWLFGGQSQPLAKFASGSAKRRFGWQPNFSAGIRLTIEPTVGLQTNRFRRSVTAGHENGELVAQPLLMSPNSCFNVVVVFREMTQTRPT